MRMSRRMALYAAGGFSENSFSFVPSDDAVVDPFVFSRDGKNWEIRILVTGSLTFLKPVNVDVFLVGGGGGGGYKGGGGGGGYTLTERDVALLKGNPYFIEIGAGGAGQTGSASSSSSASRGKTGGTTKAFSFEALGGEGGYGPNNSYSNRVGGKGGSGGGGYYNSAGGSDGGNGARGSEEGARANGGTGQGTTTRAFGENDGELFAGGGGASAYDGSSPGGDGGGGNGSYSSPTQGIPNTGSGGGGAWNVAGAAGGCGIVIIRNKREVVA